MPISPVSKGGSNGPYPSDWQSICDEMQTQIANYLQSGQTDSLSGYLSTMIAFSMGLGSDSQDLQFQKAMTNLYTLAGTGGNWQAALNQIRTLFPSTASASSIKSALINVLNSSVRPTLGSGSYTAGFQLALQDLSSLASRKDQKVLNSHSLQNAINGFIEDPDATHRDALSTAIETAISEL